MEEVTKEYKICKTGFKPDFVDIKIITIRAGTNDDLAP